MIAVIRDQEEEVEQPVMVAPTPWPPPGPLSLSLAPLLYVDLSGWEAREVKAATLTVR